MEKNEKIESPRRIRRKAKLIALIAEVGGAAQVARESGTPKSHLSAMVSGVRGLGDQLSEKLEKLYNKPSGWFDSATAAISENVNAATAQDATITRGPINLTDNPDFPAVRRVKFKLSAGASGFAVDYVDDDLAPIVFQRQWFERHGYTPADLLAVKVANGSMEPGLYHGDTVIVNTGDNNIVDGEVFAMNYEGELVIKRMVRDDGQWWLASDNPDQRRYPRKVCNEDVFCLGKIVLKQSERI